MPPRRRSRRTTKPAAEPAIIPRRWVEEMAAGFDWSFVGSGWELDEDVEDGYVYGAGGGGGVYN
jgi:hypothetical protein